jgi:Ca2+ transporting ATPase
MGFVWWFTLFPGGPQMSLEDLRSFDRCVEEEAQAKGYSCAIFKRGPQGLDRASTVALSILVIIEMLNACNALSEFASVLDLPPWTNRFLVMAIATSVSLHMFILYVPFVRPIFSVAPLGLDEGLAVVWFSVPVILIDEAMKRLTRLNIKTKGFGAWTSIQAWPLEQTSAAKHV